MRSVASLALIAVLLLVAGCADKAHPAATTEPSPTGDELPPGVTNILRGTVKTTDLAPLPGANITIGGLNVSRVTDEAGHYEITNLGDQEYLIVAAKDGYRTKTQRALMRDDAIFDLDFILEEIPIAKPYNITTYFDGFISCQASYQTAPDNTQRPNCGTTDSNNHQAKDFEVAQGAAQVVVEVTWTKVTDAAKTLTITIESVGPNAVVFAHQWGQSGMKIAVPARLVQEHLSQGGRLLVTMESGPNLPAEDSGAAVGLAFQQSFKIYFTTFFVEPAPANFSAIQKTG